MPQEALQSQDVGMAPVFDPDNFVNDWTVFSADGGTVKIEKRANNGEYRISYQDPKPDNLDRRAPQNLLYNSDMRTLETEDANSNVARSISYWQRPDGTRAVFATYKCEGPCLAKDLWPIEIDGGKGTWGADDG